MTTITIDVNDAQPRLLELLAQVAEGAVVILTQGAEPRARLVPIDPSSRSRIPGLHPGSMTASPDFDAPLPDELWTGPS